MDSEQEIEVLQATIARLREKCAARSSRIDELKDEVNGLEDERDDLDNRVVELEDELSDLSAKWHDKGCLLQQIGEL